MGFHRRDLPELEELKEIHERFETDEEFIKYIVGKSEALSGPSESHRYLDSVWERIKSKRQND